MAIKKIPKYIAQGSLTIGASLIIGFLSFSGMYALWPILPLAFAAFGLSVVYEAEVYFQNIKGAWNKLFKRDHLKRQLANDFLLNNFPDTTPLLDNFSDASTEECPAFFKNYKSQRQLLDNLNQQPQETQDPDRKKRIEKTLRKMETWFDLQLVVDNTVEAPTPPHEETEIRAWLIKHPPKWPKFVTDYQRQLNLLSQFGHKNLDKPSSASKKQVEKTLRDMEKWFATQLFSTKKVGELSPYENELRSWLALHQQDVWQTKFNQESSDSQKIKAFSLLSGLFMSLGTTYLLVEAFSVIPMFLAIPFTTWPLLILPMAAVAGTAYGALTFNAVMDMARNDTLRKWLNKIQDHFHNEGATKQNVFIATAAVFLALLALGLTICTAGTWWTVAKETRPLFAWMGKIPGVVMGVINLLITIFSALSAIAFNLQNTSESLELIDTAVRKTGSFFRRVIALIKKEFNTLLENENPLQLLNPFRLLLTITIMPLRVLLFHGHLVGIGVTSDRVPGVSKFVSALFGFTSEYFEDLHYFVPHDHGCDNEHHDEEPHHVHNHHGHGHSHEQGHEHKHGDEHDHEHSHEHGLNAQLKERLSQGHGHNHDLDIPTWLLKKLFIPVYYLAAHWDYYTSKLNTDTSKALSFDNAWNKQTGTEPEKTVTLHANSQRPSADWQMEHVVFRIENYKEKHLSHVSIGSEVAKEKVTALNELQQELRGKKMAIETILKKAKTNPVYNKHRFFDNGRAETAMFVDDLPQRINVTPQ